MRVEQIGGATLYLGDCREILPALDLVDMVVTDPPYNVGIDYGLLVDDSKTREAFILWIQKWFLECRRLSKTVLITGQVRLPDYAIVEPWKWLFAWRKPAAMGRSPVGFCEWEPIALWGNGSSAGLPDWFVAPVGGQDDADPHPCPKPVGWAKEQLRRWPNAEIILDPFMGSGTTGVACAQLGRRFIGIEIEPAYFDIACRRIEKAYCQLNLFDWQPPAPKQTEMAALDGA